MEIASFKALYGIKVLDGRKISEISLHMYPVDHA